MPWFYRFPGPAWDPRPGFMGDLAALSGDGTQDSSADGAKDGGDAAADAYVQAIASNAADAGELRR